MLGCGCLHIHAAARQQDDHGQSRDERTHRCYTSETMCEIIRKNRNRAADFAGSIFPEDWTPDQGKWFDVRGCLILFEQAGLESMRNGFGSRTRVELRQYRRDMMINSSCGGEESLGDFGIGQSLSHQCKHFHLPSCESGWILFGTGPRSPWDAAHARGAQHVTQSFSCGARSESLEDG